MRNLIVLALLFLHAIAYAQTPFKGSIKDSKTRDPLPGATITIKGTNRSTTSDNSGNFELKANKGEVIQVQYLGYTLKEITVGDASTLDIELSSSAKNMDAVTIVGSRRAGRSATESPVPIDLIDIKGIARQTGRFDINNILQFAAPSFNSNKQSGSDGADHIDPATIRGLGPDQTLVLINGKRRHQTSLINLFGTRGRGNTGTDLNAIPAAAVERVEILRDGASAQYGSDAIAGVVNVVLKSNINEFTGNINTGVFDGKKYGTRNFDGESFQVNGNYGIGIGQNGFINMTADYSTNAKTNRVPPAGAVTYRKKFGDASAESFSGFFNSSVPLADNTSFYAFGGYSYRFTDAFAWTREADDDRNVKEIYPNGFDPRIQSAIDDNSISAGIKTKHNGWNIDFNNTFGKNKMHYYVDGTLNATLQAKSPTHFDAGGFWFSQNTTGLNFSKSFDDVASGLNIAFGAEYRTDRYAIFAGEEGSWQNYGLRQKVENGAVITYDSLMKPAGSQGFPGFQPRNEVNASRSNFGSYFDAELDVTKSFLLSGAVRYEKYSDFGGTLNGKLATRIKVSNALNLRGSVSTGFRAPSLQQIYFNTIYTNFEAGVPVEILLANNQSNVTRTLGIPPLKEEKSVNLSAGFTLKPARGLTFTVDGYLINIKDRIVLTGTFDRDDPDIGAELAALGVGQANFFTNAIDSKNIGIDIIATYGTSVGGGNLNISLASNFNKLTIEKVNTSPKLQGKEDNYLSIREKSFIIASAPKSKTTLNLDYTKNRFSSVLRFIHYGEVTLLGYDDEPNVYKPKVTTDVTLGYKLSKHTGLYIGMENAFNVYPDAQDQENTEAGGLWDSVQMNFGGRRYFARLTFNF